MRVALRRALDALPIGLAVAEKAGTDAAREASRAHHQTLHVRDCHADFHAELVGSAGLSFPDALHLGRVQGIELVFVLRALAAGKRPANTG